MYSVPLNAKRRVTKIPNKSDSRREESQKIRRKYPDRIPVRSSVK